MRKKIVVFSFITLFSIITFIKLYSSEKYEDTVKSSTPVTYNIQGWNKTGSFTIETKNRKDIDTGKETGVIQLIDENGKVTRELSVTTINKHIKALQKLQDNPKYKKISNKDVDQMYNSLDELKEILADKERFSIFVENIKQTQSKSGKPFNYTLSTIWGYSNTVSGVIGN